MLSMNIICELGICFFYMSLNQKKCFTNQIAKQKICINFEIAIFP